MNPSRSTARLAGALYLVVVLTGIFSLAYVPSQLYNLKDPVDMFTRLNGTPFLFRWGIISSVICYVAFLLLPLVLYRLLHAVNETAARLMVLLAVVSVPISLVNLQHKLEVLNMIDATVYPPGAGPMPALILAAIKSFNSGLLISQIFWGLWLLPFGWLVYRSGFLPKILGIFLILGCFGYVFDFVGTLGIPGYNDTAVGKYITKPATIGEIGICLWLLTVGVWKKKEASSHSIA